MTVPGWTQAAAQTGNTAAIPGQEKRVRMARRPNPPPQGYRVPEVDLNHKDRANRPTRARRARSHQDQSLWRCWRC